MKALFDTNVLVDVLTHREPFYMDSARAWSLVASRRVEGMVAAVSMTNLYYVVERLKSRAAALEMLRRIRGEFAVVATDGAVVNRAIDSGFKDFEDAVQYFSAVAAGAECVVTRNGRDFRGSEIAVVSPGEFLAMQRA